MNETKVLKTFKKSRV